MMNIRIFLCFCSILLLSSCGFTLRGTETQTLAPGLLQLQLSYNNTSNELGQILRRRLSASGVDFATDSTGYQLLLGEEQSSERVLSVNRNIRAGEYEVILVTSFQLDNNGETVIPLEVLTLAQIYEADPSNAAAKTNEAELVLSEMRQELAEQIMRRLQTVR